MAIFLGAGYEYEGPAQSSEIDVVSVAYVNGVCEVTTYRRRGATALSVSVQPPMFVPEQSVEELAAEHGVELTGCDRNTETGKVSDVTFEPGELDGGYFIGGLTSLIGEHNLLVEPPDAQERLHALWRGQINHL